MANQQLRPSSIANSAKEAAVIIFSILVAFSLDAWWEDVQVEREVDDILGAIEVEMSGNLAALRSSVDHHKAISAAIRTLRDTSSAGNMDLGAVPQAVIEVEVFEPDTGAMDTMVATGLLNEVDDASLRLLLGAYAARLLDLNEQEIRAVEFRDAARRRLASLGFPLWNTEIRESRRQLEGDTEMLNLLSMRLSEEENAIESAQALTAHIQKILTRLEETT